MDSIQTLKYNGLIQAINELLNGSLKPTHRENLQWLMANFQVTVYLDRISRKMARAYNMKNQMLTGEIKMSNLDALKLARAELHQAPIEPLFRTYAGRVRSQGERGVLCSLNRKLYLQYKELDEFLQQLSTRMQN
jgi:hypothetical protein